MDLHPLQLVEDLNPVKHVAVHPAVDRRLLVVNVRKGLIIEEILLVLQEMLKLRETVVVFLQYVLHELLHNDLAVVTPLEAVVQPAEEVFLLHEPVLIDVFLYLVLYVGDLLLERLEGLLLIRGFIL